MRWPAWESAQRSIRRLCAFLINHFGWRGAYVGLGYLTFALAFPAVALFVREPDRDSIADREHLSLGRATRITGRGNAPGMPVGEAVKGFRFWFILIAVFLVAASVNGTIAHIVPILTDRGISVGNGHFSAFRDRNRADRRKNSERLSSGSFFRALCGRLLFSAAAYGNRTAEQWRGGNRSAVWGRSAWDSASAPKSTSWRFWSDDISEFARSEKSTGTSWACSCSPQGLGPTIMGVCYDRTHSYNLALEGFAVALALTASIFIQPAGTVCVSSAEADGNHLQPRPLRLATNLFSLAALYPYSHSKYSKSSGVRFASKAFRSEIPTPCTCFTSPKNRARLLDASRAGNALLLIIGKTAATIARVLQCNFPRQ